MSASYYWWWKTPYTCLKGYMGRTTEALQALARYFFMFTAGVKLTVSRGLQSISVLLDQRLIIGIHVSYTICMICICLICDMLSAYQEPLRYDMLHPP